MINNSTPEAFQFAYSPTNIFDSVSGFSIPEFQSNGNHFSITDLESFLQEDEVVSSVWTAGCGSPVGSKVLGEPNCWESVETDSASSRSSSRLMIDFEDIMQEDDDSTWMGLKFPSRLNRPNHWDSLESTTTSSCKVSSSFVVEEQVVKSNSLSEKNNRQIYLDFEAQDATIEASRSSDSVNLHNAGAHCSGDLEDFLDIFLNEVEQMDPANCSLIDTSFSIAPLDTSSRNDQTDWNHANTFCHFHVDSLQLDNCDAFFASNCGLQESQALIESDQMMDEAASCDRSLVLSTFNWHDCEEPAQESHAPSFASCPVDTNLSNSGEESLDRNTASSHQSATIMEPKKSEFRKSVSPMWAGPTIFDIESALAMDRLSSCGKDSSRLFASFEQGNLKEEMKGHSALAGTARNAEFRATTRQRSSWTEEPLANEGDKFGRSWLLNRRNQQQHRHTTKVPCAEDVVEDGYRWRKYGQKTIKHSPFPRSYYKCTSSKCKVKKQVERSAQDPNIMLVTYEGLHVHHRPNPLIHMLGNLQA